MSGREEIPLEIGDNKIEYFVLILIMVIMREVNS